MLPRSDRGQPPRVIDQGVASAHCWLLNCRFGMLFQAQKRNSYIVEVETWSDFGTSWLIRTLSGDKEGPLNQADHGIVNFDAVIDGSVYRGGQPTSPDSWAFLKSIGIRTVVKLDYQDEGVDDGALALGLVVIDCRMPPRDFWEAVGKPQPEDVASAVDALSSENNWPVYVHCLHGQDRTGLIVGEFRVLKQHWTTDRAYAEMLQYGFHAILHDVHEAWEDFVVAQGTVG